MGLELHWINTRPTQPGYYWCLGCFVAPRSSTPPCCVDGDVPIVCRVIDNPFTPGSLIVLVAGDDRCRGKCPTPKADGQGHSRHRRNDAWSQKAGESRGRGRDHRARLLRHFPSLD